MQAANYALLFPDNNVTRDASKQIRNKLVFLGFSAKLIKEKQVNDIYLLYKQKQNSNNRNTEKEGLRKGQVK